MGSSQKHPNLTKLREKGSWILRILLIRGYALCVGIVIFFSMNFRAEDMNING